MPDLLAGSTVQDIDTPVAVADDDDTDFNDISGTTYAAGTPELGVQFVGPTSGRVLVLVHMLGDTDNTTNRLFLSSEVYEGTDATGTLMASASDQEAAGLSTVSTLSLPSSAWRVVSGLTPGATHYARTMHRVSAGAVADLSHRKIAVIPLS